MFTPQHQRMIMYTHMSMTVRVVLFTIIMSIKGITNCRHVVKQKIPTGRQRTIIVCAITAATASNLECFRFAATKPNSTMSYRHHSRLRSSSALTDSLAVKLRDRCNVVLPTGH